VRLARLALQAVFLIPVMRMIVSALARVRSVIMDILLVLLDALLVHFIEDLHAQLDIT
jgi:hypothetical protein